MLQEPLQCFGSKQDWEDAALPIHMETGVFREVLMR